MRADVYLTEAGYAASRQQAKNLILSGSVTLDGGLLTKPAAEIPEGAHTVCLLQTQRYVGRGAWKLEAALQHFGVDVRDRIALDIGASTGGFTDCLLQHGAKRVYAVDSGSGQLAARLREDARVVSMERVNARYLTADAIGCRVQLVVMDVSFISATYLIPNFRDWMQDAAEAICLIKPQFEVGKSRVGKGGIVKDAAAHRMAIDRVVDCAKASGLQPAGLIASPITGGDGNREFLLYLTRGRAKSPQLSEQQIRAAVMLRKGEDHAQDRTDRQF